MLQIAELTEEYYNKLQELVGGKNIYKHPGISKGNFLVAIDYEAIDFIRPTGEAIIMMIHHEAIAIPRSAFYQIEMM